jgi:hypothetical protein
MSVVIETLVICDGCGENCSGDDGGKNARDIRATRKLYGWIQRGSLDYCEICANKPKVLTPSGTTKENQP